jgi:hypothetical protein
VGLSVLAGACVFVHAAQAGLLTTDALCSKQSDYTLTLAPGLVVDAERFGAC